VLNAAIEFFDNDQEGDQSKGLMYQSRKCCSLLPPTVDGIKSHLDLIEATHLMLIKYGLYESNILPIQIRLHKDRIQLIKVLVQTNPELYAKAEVLSQIAKLLISQNISTARSQLLMLLYKAIGAHLSEDYEAEQYFYRDVLQKIKTDQLSLDETVSTELELGFDRVASNSVISGRDKLSVFSDAMLVESEGINFRKVERLWKNAMKEVIYNSRETDFLKLVEQLRGYNLDRQDRNEKIPGITRIMMHDFFQPVGSPVAGSYNR
jgi:hypothetical protein